MSVPIKSTSVPPGSRTTRIVNLV